VRGPSQDRALLRVAHGRVKLAVAPVLLVALLVLCLVGLRVWSGSGSARAVGVATATNTPPTATDSFEPDLGMPATHVVAIGASPGSKQVWASGMVGAVPAIVDGKPYANQQVLLDHTESLNNNEAGGWQVVPLPLGPEEHPLGLSSAQAMWDGGLAALTSGGIVTLVPAGRPQLVSAPASVGAGAVLGESETVAASGLPFAPVEAQEHTGVLIVPSSDGKGKAMGVLSYSGTNWTREALEGASITPTSGFVPEALACGGIAANETDASSPANCWLLAAYRNEAATGGPNRLALFRRVTREPTPLEPAEYKWEETAINDPSGSLLGEVNSPAGEELSITALDSGGAQMLTVTSQGVWVDFQAKLGNSRPTDVSKFVLPVSSAQAEVTGTWCFPDQTFCSQPSQTLGAAFPSNYRSFAWPGSGKSAGTRIITGLANRVMLELPGTGGGFIPTIGAGGSVGFEPGAAAFSEPQQGWIADAARPTAAPDGEGQSQVIEVTSQPSEDRLREEPVPFRRPLYAVAQMPGMTPGDPNAQAIAVGERGEVTHFMPGQGWRAEALYDSAGELQPQTLRGVAWPEPGRAYAVGDNGAMWVWRAETGLWEPDPAKPLNFVGNLTAISFSPTNPGRGYAVGVQGVLLRFGKSWEQEPTCAANVLTLCMSPELQGVTFTSVAFAGEQALATYQKIERNPAGSGLVVVGGLAAQEGSGPWHVESGAAALLANLPPTTLLSRVAGLPDGGTVAAGPGLAIERESLTATWQFTPQPLAEAQNVSALAAYRDSAGAIRAAVSIELDPDLNPEYSPEEQLEVPAGQPPVALPPEFSPNSGYLLEQTATGWNDMEHQALPAPSSSGDMPARPDPVLAVLVGSGGEQGLAVGGQTGDIEGGALNPEQDIGDISHQTAAVMRFPASAASSDGAVSSPVGTTPGDARFVVAGQAACEQPCADFANEGLGPDVDLSHALQMANRIAGETPGGLRAFLYAGRRIANPPPPEPEPEAIENFERQLTRYASILGNSSVPVLAAASPDDLAPGGRGIGPFASLLAPFLPGAESDTAYYSYTSRGVTGGSVQVIVLDFSTGELGTVQQRWLEARLREAQEKTEKGELTPAIVLGSASLGFQLPGGPVAPEARDAAQVSATLVADHASAYFFYYPESNVHGTVSFDGHSIPAFGTGTMGYVRPPNERTEADSLGSSGFLLAEVNPSKVEEAPNVVQVTARVVPNIAQLALDATNGVLLRRSQVALFEGLARRPLGGVALGQGPGGTESFGPDPYDQIPFDCLGAKCAYEVPTEYTFTSSNPDIGGFVAHDPTSNNPRQVLLGSDQLPVPDEHSGLFCPYNEGTTVVSVTTGGLTYSEPVTVQGGSVEYPCGTVPLKNPPPIQLPAKFNFAPIEPAPANTPPTNPLVQSILPPPAPVPVHPKPHRLPHPPPLAAVPYAPPVSGANPAIVPPPPTPAAEPTPPSGTSQVFATSPEEKKEEERALEMSANKQAVVYDSNSSTGPSPWLALMLVVIAAGAGVGMRPGRGSRSPERPALALATVRRRRPRR
jgi:hypothetical protein